ncbi:MAG: hypothetical protein J5744_03400 [Oscillospiraceae bacterium]|nr:hypothetical protein [Oscillospiraceae bacterium]
MSNKVIVPYEKMSKKAKREHDLRKRRDWGGLNPVTRKPENPRAYNRSREKARSIDERSKRRVFVRLGSVSVLEEIIL